VALLTLANLIDEVQDEIPAKEQAPIVRAVNKVIRRINVELVAPERSTFTTKVATTTGTVSVTLASTTATFSSGVLSTSDPLRLVQIEGDSNWFTVTRNAADTDGILSSAWAETTDGTATYTIVYPTVTFPAAVGEILEIRRLSDDPLDFQPSMPRPETTGHPRCWSPYSLDTTAASPSDDLLRIMLDPAPDTAEVFTYLYRPRATFLSGGGATTQTIPFSNLWYDVIVSGTLFYLWKQEAEHKRAMLQSALYEAAIAKARGVSTPTAIIKPRSRSRGMYAYEERPITGA